MSMDHASLLATTLAAIKPSDSQALAAAQERQTQLTKPAGSLGLLEEVGNQMSAIFGQVPPPLPSHPVLAVFAADHGVYAQGVTPWPQEVTVQMLANICYGGASINALAPETGTTIWPIDIGVAYPVPDAPGLRRHRVADGTQDFTAGPAMTPAQTQQALEVGISLARQAVAEGADILLTGEVGLGNTTTSAALIAAFTGVDPAAVTGRGTGVDDAMLATKVDVVRRALVRHQPDPTDALGVLAALGGLEHAGMAGFVLGGAAAGVPVILDGVISCSAGLAAVRLCPTAKDYLIAGHRGEEPGIQVALDAMGLDGLVDLGLRLGEGSGALVALCTVRGAVRILRDMATFAEAGVAGRKED